MRGERLLLVQEMGDGGTKLIGHGASDGPAERMELVCREKRTRDDIVAGFFDIGGDIDNDLFPSYRCYHLGQLTNSDVTVWIGDVVGLLGLAHEEDVQEGGNAIDHIAPGAILRTIALHDDILSCEHIADELRIDTVVGIGEIGAIDMTRTGDANIDAILVTIGDAEGLGGTFGRRIAGTKGDGIDITAVVLGEDATIALAIDFA